MVPLLTLGLTGTKQTVLRMGPLTLAPDAFAGPHGDQANNERFWMHASWQISAACRHTGTTDGPEKSCSFQVMSMMRWSQGLLLACFVQVDEMAQL